MSFSLLLSFFVPALFGFLLCLRVTSIRELLALLAAGVVVGLSFYSTAVFLGTFYFDLAVSAYACSVLFLFLTVFLFFYSRNDFKSEVYLDFIYLRFFPIIAIISYFLVSRIYIEALGVVQTGHLNCYGDLPLHIGIIKNFVEGQTFPPESPIYSGTFFVYPFLADFYSAVMISLGGTLKLSLVVPFLALFLSGATLFYTLVREFTEDVRASLFALILFVFHGSTFGFLRLFDFSPESFLGRLVSGSFSYLSGSAGDKDGFFLPNPVLAYFIPQRSFLFGFSLLVLVMLLFRSLRSTRSSIVVGLLLSIFPLFHPHSLLVLIFPLLYFSFKVSVKHLVVVFLCALPIGLLELSYFLFYSTIESHLKFSLGWMAGDTHPLLFWLMNSGLLIASVFCFLFFKKVKSEVRTLAVIGYFLFVLANTFLFARWQWDNTKILVYAFLFFLPLIGSALSLCYDRKILKPFVLLFIALHSVSAVYDFVQYGSPNSKQYTLWSSSAAEAARLVAEKTAKSSTILSAPIHNSIAMLAGRRMLLGFPGMVWTHGGSFRERKEFIKKFYQGAARNLENVSIDYILIGPDERSRYRPIFIDPSWSLVFKTRHYSLYSPH